MSTGNYSCLWARAVETIFVSTPRDVALARVAARPADADDFQLSAELAAAYFDNFDVPTPEEEPLTVVSGSAADDAPPKPQPVAHGCPGRVGGGCSAARRLRIRVTSTHIA